tara:strand:- start:30026 stop:30355 length:330 start_codon:yes stop_codon:yes gene_type:complete
VTGLAVIWFGYVMYVLFFTKKTKSIKNRKKLAYVRLNNIFVNNSDNEQTDSGAVLDQITEVENASKLLEVFEKGSLEEDSNSLTRKKHEKLKVIRNEDTADEDPPDPET